MSSRSAVSKKRLHNYQETNSEFLALITFHSNIEEKVANNLILKVETFFYLSFKITLVFRRPYPDYWACCENVTQDYGRKILNKWFHLDLKPGKCSFLTLFVPLFGPKAWADTRCHLPHVFTAILIAGVLYTKKPFVVPIPAVICLVLGSEPSIAWSSANTLDDINRCLLLLGELKWFRRKDSLQIKWWGLGWAQIFTRGNERQEILTLLSFTIFNHRLCHTDIILEAKKL